MMDSVRITQGTSPGEVVSGDATANRSALDQSAQMSVTVQTGGDPTERRPHLRLVSDAERPS